MSIYCIKLTFTIPANTSSANVTLPIKNAGGGTPMWSGANTIDWGDGNINDSLLHTFPNIGSETSYTA